MPIAFEILPTQSLVLVKGWGALEGDDLVRGQIELRQDPRIRPTMRQLIDMREVTELEVRTDTLRYMATRHPFADTARRALVATSDVAFGLSRMYQMLSDGDDRVFGVFRDLDPALAHLELLAERTTVIDALAALGENRR